MLENREAFRLLPRARRRALGALGAWSERSDRIARTDATLASRREALAAWRLELDALLAGRLGEVHAEEMLALAPVLGAFPIPRGLLIERVAKSEMDLEAKAMEDASALEKYAFRAGAVEALLALEVLGHADARARPFAVSVGMAGALARVLGEVEVERRRGRILLPLSDLEQHGVVAADLLAGRDSPGLRAAVAATRLRARAHLAQAVALCPRSESRTLFPLLAALAVSERLLERIEAAGDDVLGPALAVPRRSQVVLALAAWARTRLTRSGPIGAGKL